MTTRKDERTKEQKKTHCYLITETDHFLSNWGLAGGGLSKCAWACKTEQVDKVDKWVRSRSEMKYVNFHDERGGRGWYPKAAHVHIFFVDDKHPALKG